MDNEQHFNAGSNEASESRKTEKNQGGWYAIEHINLFHANKITSRQPEPNDGFPLRNRYELPLWERILAWCQYIHWYGPDSYDPVASEAYYARKDDEGDRDVYDPRTRFGFPVVTPEQLRKVEEDLGISHPPLLHDLYLHVANGGFGPAKGLIGIPGGFCYLLHRDSRYDAWQKESLIQDYGEEFCRNAYPTLFDPLPFDLAQHEQHYDYPQLICLAEREWPTYFLQLCGGDEEETFYVHTLSGRVYLVGNAWGEERTLTGEKAATLLHSQADSLEEWFERWLAGRMEKQYHTFQT
jgi:hypothetical protein